MGQQLLVVSDVHLEFPEARRQFVVPPEAIEAADIIVLAGDIAVGTQGLVWAAKAFLGKPILFVSGNHSLYGGHVSKVHIAMHQVARELGIHLLDNSTVEIDGVTFCGGTLWTDFRLFGNSPAKIGEALHQAKNRIADFSCITFGSTGWMTPSDSVKLFNVTAQYIEDELNKPHPGPVVVVTHHAPSLQSSLPKFRDDILTAAFASNLEHLMGRCDLWLHGHMHNSSDYLINGTRVVCNPRGYPMPAIELPAGWICDRCIESAALVMRSPWRTCHAGTCTTCGRTNVELTNAEDLLSSGCGIENPAFDPGLIVDVGSTI